MKIIYILFFIFTLILPLFSEGGSISGYGGSGPIKDAGSDYSIVTVNNGGAASVSANVNLELTKSSKVAFIIRNGSMPSTHYFTGTNKPSIPDSKLSADSLSNWVGDEFFISAAMYTDVATTVNMHTYTSGAPRQVTFVNGNDQISANFVLSTPSTITDLGWVLVSTISNPLNFSGNVVTYQLTGNIDPTTVTPDDESGIYTGYFIFNICVP